VVFVRNAVLTVLVMDMSGLAVGMAFLSMAFAARAPAPNVKLELVHCAHAPEDAANNRANAAVLTHIAPAKRFPKPFETGTPSPLSDSTGTRIYAPTHDDAD
jgi:hypothetical protein